MTVRNGIVAAAITMAVLTAAGPAVAHPGHEHATFLDGLAHPVGGLDHLAAMLAVGLWAGLAGAARRWVWPATFVSAMAIGAVIGWFSLPSGAVELLAAASVLALGAAIAAGWSPSALLGGAAIAAFGVAHGFAHGAEMPGEQFVNPYAAGFLVATMALHALGLAAAVGLARMPGRAVAPRLAGGMLAVLGVGLVAGAIVA